MLIVDIPRTGNLIQDPRRQGGGMGISLHELSLKRGGDLLERGRSWHPCLIRTNILSSLSLYFALTMILALFYVSRLLALWKGASTGKVQLTTSR